MNILKELLLSKHLKLELLKNLILNVGIFSFLCFILLVSHSCSSERIDTSVYLVDKPLDSIKYYIKGKWYWLYTKPGFTANPNIILHENSWIEFKENDNVTFVHESKQVYDTIIQWERIKNLQGDSTYRMKPFNSDLQNFSFSWAFREIKNGKLYAYQVAFDGAGHVFSRNDHFK